MKAKYRRYYLHRMLKKKEIRYNPYKRTIYRFFDEPTDDKHIQSLNKDFGYNVQLEIR
ncbi:hypothetical protein [Corallibacter sp.]|uniref:hypothetical protein n=1 Tax=Corallibacter sp. TaxID=2038084 RepID=UPI003A9007EF